MKINIANLKKEPATFDFDFSPEYLSEGADDLKFSRGAGTITFRMTGTEILATGTLRSEVTGKCGRCLEKAVVPLAADVHLYYLPARPDTGSKIADIDPMEPDYGTYEGEDLDPDEDLRELLLVEAPTVFLCSPDCKGLCLSCGKNLNDGPCGCKSADAEETSDSWKAKLKEVAERGGAKKNG